MSSTTVDIAALRKKMVCRKTGALWIYGYGSLIWRPGFSYKRRVVGKLNHYVRRFFQGTTTHRGTPDWPGRVATILSAENDCVWGVAYQVEGPVAIDDALKHLAEREMITGGYRFERVLFHPRDEDPFYIQVYIADSINKQYLGDASIMSQAYQIVHARGVCGPNIEYVQKVVDFMMQEVPHGVAADPYLQELNDCIYHLERGQLLLSESILQNLPMRVAEVQGDEEFARIKRVESESSIVSLTSSSGSCACGIRHEENCDLQANPLDVNIQDDFAYDSADEDEERGENVEDYMDDYEEDLDERTGRVNNENMLEAMALSLFTDL